MQNDCQLPGDGDLGLLEADAFPSVTGVGVARLCFMWLSEKGPAAFVRYVQVRVPLDRSKDSTTRYVSLWLESTIVMGFSRSTIRGSSRARKGCAPGLRVAAPTWEVMMTWFSQTIGADAPVPAGLAVHAMFLSGLHDVGRLGSAETPKLD